MKPIKIAQIGTEHDHAPAIADTLRKRPDLFEFIGYCNPEDIHAVEDENKIYKEIPKLTLEEIWNTPGLEAVAIETSEHNLCKYALEAAKRGLHMHMDKPGGQKLEEFEELVAILKEKNLTFSTGYMYRFNPYINEALEIVRSGKLGTIYSVEAHMDCEHKPSKRQWLGQYQGGMMFFLGCHLVDLIVQVMGIPEEVVPFNTRICTDGVDSEDMGMAVFKYKNGLAFAKTSAAEPGGFMRRQLVICGNKGTIEIRPLEWYDNSVETVYKRTPQKTKMRIVYESGNWNEDGETKISFPIDRYGDMMFSFAQVVRGEKENPVSYDYELELYKVVLKTCGFEVK